MSLTHECARKLTSESSNIIIAGVSVTKTSDRLVDARLKKIFGETLFSVEREVRGCPSLHSQKINK